MSLYLWLLHYIIYSESCVGGTARTKPRKSKPKQSIQIPLNPPVASVNKVPPAKPDLLGGKSVATQGYGSNTDYSYADRRKLSAELSAELSSTTGPWFEKDGTGTSFFVSTSDGLTLLRYGTLCGESIAWNTSEILSEESDCLVGMANGNYIWRVTGASDRKSYGVSWEFCDETGGAKSELFFAATNGGCSSEKQINSSDYGALAHELTLTGAIKLFGVSAGERTLSDQESTSLSRALAQEITDARFGNAVESKDITITSFSSTSPAPGARSLHVESSIVSFRLLADFSAVTASGLDIDEYSLRSYVEAAVGQGGIFSTRLRAEALHQRGSLPNRFKDVKGALLLSLTVVHETEERAVFSIVSSAVVTVGVIAGVLFGILLLVSFMRRYVKGPLNHRYSRGGKDGNLSIVARDDALSMSMHPALPVPNLLQQDSSHAPC